MIWDSLKSDVMWSHNVWITPIHLNREEEWIKEVHKKWVDFIQISTLADLKNFLSLLNNHFFFYHSFFVFIYTEYAQNYK